MTKSKHTKFLLYGISHCHSNKKIDFKCTPILRYLQARYFFSLFQFHRFIYCVHSSLEGSIASFTQKLTILEIPIYLFKIPSFPLDCGMLIIFKQDGWGNLLCLCSSATRRNNFLEKKIGEIVNQKKYLAVILVYLETPKTVPMSFSWEKYGS